MQVGGIEFSTHIRRNRESSARWVCSQTRITDGMTKTELTHQCRLAGGTPTVR